MTFNFASGGSRKRVGRGQGGRPDVGGHAEGAAEAKVGEGGDGEPREEERPLPGEI